MGDPRMAAEILDRAVHHLPGSIEHFAFKTKTSKGKNKTQLGAGRPPSPKKVIFRT